MMNEPHFNGFTFKTLFQANTLELLDQQFLAALSHHDPQQHDDLLTYRHHPQAFSPTQVSELLIACAKVLENFIAQLFDIQPALEATRQATLAHDPILAFKKWFVMRQARRRLKEVMATPFNVLDAGLTKALAAFQLDSVQDRELAIAQLARHYLTDKEKHAEAIEQLIQWCVQALVTPEGQAAVQGWVSFCLPQQTAHEHLVPLAPVPDDALGRLQGLPSTQRQRQGFQLTDCRMSARAVQGEIHYCIYCHDHAGDLCAKGFLQKKSEPQAGFRQDPLGNMLTGCPLEEKISEMQLLKRDGYTLAALAMIMIDNPFCPATGHRICNDCMKSCIYQKQTPVNIPQIETRVLTDVLALPWGVEIYDLLTRWHPLRQQQWCPKPYNGLKILIAGQGPAGFTLAHHLLMEGFAVVGIDGLKIEPLPDIWLNNPIQDYTALQEALDARIVNGFGGVAEYGITCRWDKNFLKLIYLSLARRPYFQIYGNTRFGGTLTVETAWHLGFDHLAIAVGAGLPQALPIPGSLAPGMRQAADFLMTLQLTGAAKENSLANLQIRLPALIIGGGLTGIDAATEVQAYYLAQLDKVAHRYTQLVDTLGHAAIHEQLDDFSQALLSEWLTHAEQWQAERQRAKAAGTTPDIHDLLKQWGGVTVVYRRTLQESPAYIRNHEEVQKALEEGIFYLEGLEPKAAQLDVHGHIQALVCRKRYRDAQSQWQTSDEEVVLPARTILVATGATPNIAYEFEHRGHFERQGFQYQPYQHADDALQPVALTTHCKVDQFGAFTSYAHLDYRVSFLGDTHPAFHGSVVKAIASAKRVYPDIVQLLRERAQVPDDDAEYAAFKEKLHTLLHTEVVQVQRHTETVIEVTVRAPLAAQQFRPGQFFRLQNFERTAPLVEDTRLQMEALALRCAGVNLEAGTVRLIILEGGSSSRLCATLQPGDAIALMGPTGAKTKIPAGSETMMVVGGRLAAANLLTLGPALRAAGNRVLYIAGFQAAEAVFCQEALEAATDAIVWITAQGEPVTTHRPQDRAVTGDFLTHLVHYAATTSVIPLQQVTQVLITGGYELVRLMQKARQHELRDYLHQSAFTAAVHGPMQCMLKGVCAQCLQWQIDPKTQQRTKAVFACSWQDQPLDIIDIDNLDERLQQNRLQEILSNLWIDHLFLHHQAVKKV